MTDSDNQKEVRIRKPSAWWRKTPIIYSLYILTACHKPAPTPVALPKPSPTPSPTAIATPTATPVAKATATPVVTPDPTAVPTAPSPPPSAFQQGMARIFTASETGFRGFRGKLKRTETGTGPNALFKSRRIYQGAFTFAEATSAELEEVYYRQGRHPVYNYHLYFVTPAMESVQKWDELQQQLESVLKDFIRDRSSRYVSWRRNDKLQTAILLSTSDSPGIVELQIHVAFQSPQW